VAGAAVLCCLPVLASALPVSVPRLTARQLESRIIGSQRLAFAGYAESDATFGLPPLPAFSSVTPLLDGVTRMRVWQAAPDRWRVDTLSDTGENDTYQVGGSTFVWDSGEQLLTGIYGPQTVRLPRAADLVPAALAVRIINEAGPDATVSLLPPQRLAGQSAAGVEPAVEVRQRDLAGVAHAQQVAGVVAGRLLHQGGVLRQAAVQVRGLRREGDVAVPVEQQGVPGRRLRRQETAAEGRIQVTTALGTHQN